MEVAGRLFAEHSYHGTSIRMLAGGSLRGDIDPGAALWILYSAIVGMVGERHGDGGGIPSVPSTATLVDVLLRGLAGR